MLSSWQRCWERACHFDLDACCNIGVDLCCGDLFCDVLCYQAGNVVGKELAILTLMRVVTLVMICAVVICSVMYYAIKLATLLGKSLPSCP